MQRQLTRQMLMIPAVFGLAMAQSPPPAPVAPVASPPATMAAPARVIQFTSAGGGSYLGIGVQDVDTGRARALKLKEERGVEVTAVEQDSPAAKAGLRKGDVVLEMSGQRVEGVEQFVRMVRETPVGREVRLSNSRGGEAQTLVAKVAQRKSWTINGERGTMVPAIPMPSPGGPSPMPALGRMDLPRPYISWRNGALGIEAEALRGGLAEFFGVKQGVLVRSVTKGSPAEKAGLKAGDVIVRVNDKPVDSPSAVAAVAALATGTTGATGARERGDRKTLNLVIIRDKKEQAVAVTLEDDEHGMMMPALRPVQVQMPVQVPAQVRSVRVVGDEDLF